MNTSYISWFSFCISYTTVFKVQVVLQTTDERLGFMWGVQSCFMDVLKLEVSPDAHQVNGVHQGDSYNPLLLNAFYGKIIVDSPHDNFFYHFKF